MNRFLLLIACGLIGILISSCAPTPHNVVPTPVSGSHSGAPHRSAKRHHVAVAQVPLRRPKAANEGHSRLLSPWNYSPAPETPAAASPHTDHLPTDPHVSTPPHTLEIRPPHYWRWEK
jgi:hypothetical protein